MVAVDYDKYGYLFGEPYDRDEAIKTASPSRPQAIVTAAILFQGKIWTAYSHDDIKQAMWEEEKILARTIPEGAHGFISDNGIFFGREPSAKIAFKAGQTEKKLYRLYSDQFTRAPDVGVKRSKEKE